MGNTHMAQIARFEADNYVTKWTSPDDFKWGYGRDRGPENWWVHFPAASGQNQSPIDIVPEEAELETDYKTYPLGMTYHRQETRVLENIGTTWQVQVHESKSVVYGGPLKYKYVLKDFHMHWGEKDDVGSEHHIRNRPASGELHFVHWNCEKYSSYEEAAEGDDGLCILAVFVYVDNGSSTGNGLSTILEQLENIKMKGMAVELSSFDIASMFPEDIGKYWSYKGSLTEPPCTENVIYVLFFNHITITSDEIARIRTLCSYGSGESRPPIDEFDGKILRNYRPLQHRGQRVVTTSETAFKGQNDFQNQYANTNLFQPMSMFSKS